MQGAPSRFALGTPIPLGVASGARSDGIGLSPLQGQRQADPVSARCRCGAESGAGAECYAELPGVVIT
jgi:hypothetical protein